MNRIHVLDSTAAAVDPYDELVVAIGKAGTALRAKGVQVVEVESPSDAARYVRRSRPAMLRVSLADPLGFFDALLDQDGAHRRLVA
jgi:hypothetical protein